MTAAFWIGYLAKVAILALVLAALYLLARRLHGTVLFARGGRRIELLETTMLSQHAALHVVGVGSRQFLIGSTAGAVSRIAELPPTLDVEVAELPDLVSTGFHEVDLAVQSER